MITVDTNMDTNLLDEKKFHSIKSSLYNAEGISYNEFKKTLKPVYSKVWLSIALGWLLLFIALIAGAHFIIYFHYIGLKLFFVLVDAIFLGFIITYILNFFHEAGHYNIASDKTSNDLLANMFLGILIAQSIKQYRIVHWQHHIKLGSTEDTERSYFEALTPLFFIENLTGIRALKVFLFRNKKASAESQHKDSASAKSEARIMLLAGLVFHLAVLSIFILTKTYWLSPVWIIGFGIFFPFFSSLRQLLEHRNEMADKKTDYTIVAHGKITRIFNSNLFASMYGSAGFTRHLLHHLEPQISYTNLNQLELFLQETIIAPQLKKQKTSYLKALKILFGK